MAIESKLGKGFCIMCGVSLKDLEDRAVAGAGGIICHSCIADCTEIVAEQIPEWRDEQIERLLKLRDAELLSRR